MTRAYSADWVVPVDSEPIRDGAVLVEGDTITAVGTKEEIASDYPDPEWVEYSDSAIMPGLVNCHAHLELTGLRGSVDEFDFDFLTWLKTITSLRLELEDEESIGFSALLGAAEMVAGGVTTVADIGRMAYAGHRALNEIGMRGIVFQETEFYPDSRDSGKGFESVRSKFELVRSQDNGLVTTGISPHAPYTVSGELFERIACYSKEEGVSITIHAAESRHEKDLLANNSGLFAENFYSEMSFEAPGTSVIRYLETTGILETRPLLAHCILIDREEARILADNCATVAHCPVSNAKFGHGVAPLDMIRGEGVGVGIGSDSMASNNRCDLFEESRVGLLLQRAKGDEELSASDMIRMMTLDGAKAMGLGEEIGSLTSGKQADFIVIKIDGYGQLPVHNIDSTLVFSTNRSAVTDTFVAGKPVYQNGAICAIDEVQLKEKVIEHYLK